MFKFKLGTYVKDKLTGYEGIINSRIIRSNGCVQYSVKPRTNPDGSMGAGYYIDGDYLEVDLAKSIVSEHGDPIFRFKCGEKVQSTKTSYTGYVAAQDQSINGCIVYSVTSLQLNEGKVVKQWFDETELKTLHAHIVQEQRTTGGRSSPSDH